MKRELDDWVIGEASPGVLFRGAVRRIKRTVGWVAGDAVVEISVARGKSISKLATAT